MDSKLIHKITIDSNQLFNYQITAIIAYKAGVISRTRLAEVCGINIAEVKKFIESFDIIDPYIP
ncbi:MAG: hypothetical protein ACREBJ_03735 [Nitrosotalea sp.]